MEIVINKLITYCKLVFSLAQQELGIGFITLFFACLGAIPVLLIIIRKTKDKKEKQYFNNALAILVSIDILMCLLVFLLLPVSVAI